jgi:hypothetical protein
MSTNFRQIQQLVNAHKIAEILVPLIEAVEINKTTRGVSTLSLTDMFAHVIDTGGEIYRSLLDKNENIIDTGLVSDKLFLVLAKAMRNSVVLYNSASLSLVKDEIGTAFDDNIEFIQRYQNDIIKQVGSEEKMSSRDLKRVKQESLGYVAAAVSQMVMPLWLFHTNLYTSGFINAEEMASINKSSSGYMLALLEKLQDKMKESYTQNGKGDNKDFLISSMHLNAEMIANVVHDFNGKLIKNKKSLDEYIANPIVVLAKLVPPIYANMLSLNDVAEKALFSNMD